MKSKEAQLQTACVRYFRYRYPKHHKLLFAVPNGGFRNAREAMSLKLQGVVPGVADLILLTPRHNFSSFCIEMKTGSNKQTAHQKAWQSVAEGEGNLYKVVKSFDEFKENVDWYMSGN